MMDERNIEKELLDYINTHNSVSLTELTKILDANLVEEQVIGRVKVKGNVTETRVIILTPRLAEYFLLRNKSNRPVSKASITKYAQSMSDDEWSYDGANITFDKYGNLINGQHRLKAIIESGVTLEMSVSTGYLSEIFSTMDIVNTRKGSDTLSIAGIPFPTLMSQTIRFVHKFGQGAISANAASAERNVNSKKGLSNTQQLELANSDETYMDGVNFYNRIRPYVQPSGIVGSHVIAGLHSLLTKSNDGLDSRKAEAFLTTMVSGEGMVLNTSLFHLRNRLVNSRMALTKAKTLTHSDMIKLIIFGWNKQKEGAILKQLKVPKDLPKIK